VIGCRYSGCGCGAAAAKSIQGSVSPAANSSKPGNLIHMYSPGGANDRGY